MAIFPVSPGSPFQSSMPEEVNSVYSMVVVVVSANVTLLYSE